LKEAYFLRFEKLAHGALSEAAGPPAAARPDAIMHLFTHCWMLSLAGIRRTIR